MRKNKLESPEIVSKKAKESRKLILLRKIINYFKRIYNLRKWSHHSDPRNLNWSWSEINYNRIALVNLLINKKDNANYLEIGCGNNALFNSVPVLNKVGVDPFFGGNEKKTSDNFFQNNTKNFDLIFIDGLHTYEQVRKDIINSLKFLNEGGYIAIHDMLPRNWIENHIPILSDGPWTGDVWKVAFELIETPGIEFKIIKIDCGVGIIKVFDKEVKLKNLRSKLINKEYSFFYDNLKKLPITEWYEAQPWLNS